ncbi:hypothetical protein [Algoriphagus confluentis]|uniref:Uncharacterized protein n=1 Tax=Algoriphagus confluentis TaxID=1697556 RepID=A0ABQ6PRR4_9BACT|nr:hypothetical protein Aconfl_32690 [Algoriphagus confluentis]
MGVYNYLFYKGYQLALRSKNFDDLPVLGGIIFVVACVMFNVFTISFLLEGFGIISISFKKEYKYPFVLILIIVLLLYYLLNFRYKAIVQKYEERERDSSKGIHPVFVIVIYYGISFGLLLLSGLFKNKDWIFS